MSDNSQASTSYINQLVVKAIKKREKKVSSHSKTKLEYVLFSQFDVLDTIPSQSGDTTLYHLAKKDDPTKQICCKVLNEGAPEHSKTILINEASRLEVSQHPSVAEFIKVGSEFDRPYLMYEWIQGESLAEKMARHSKKGFRHDHIAWLVYQLAGGLEYMHTRGVIHLDIKPANVIIAEGDNVKLIDFGASRYIDEKQPYSEASIKYASPEYLDSGMACPEDDVYSLALLTGHLFLGAVFGDGWLKQLKARRYPKVIPKHVARILRKIIKNPRGHGYSAFTFAQQLARIDAQALDNEACAPIFNNLRNADLVLRPKSRLDGFRFARMRYLEASLVAALCVVTGSYVYQSNQPEWKSIVRENNPSNSFVSSIKPAQAASFLAQPPWEIETALTEMSKDVVSMAPYNEAYQVQQHSLEKTYNSWRESIAEKQNHASAIPASIQAIRKDVVSLRTALASDGALFPKTDELLISVMSQLNHLNADTEQISRAVGYTDEQLMELILKGHGVQVADYIKASWHQATANQYLYSQALPQQLSQALVKVVDEDVNRHYYSRAIDNVTIAMGYFGETPDLKQKVRDLKVARSEFILFSTVTEKSIFDASKLNASLIDLERNAPKKFSEVKDLLDKMATDSIDKSHQKFAPAKGAIAVQKALRDYRTSVEG